MLFYVGTQYMYRYFSCSFIHFLCSQIPLSFFHPTSCQIFANEGTLLDRFLSLEWLLRLTFFKSLSGVDDGHTYTHRNAESVEICSISHSIHIPLIDRPGQVHVFQSWSYTGSLDAFTVTQLLPPTNNDARWCLLWELVRMLSLGHDV